VSCSGERNFSAGLCVPAELLQITWRTAAPAWRTRSSVWSRARKSRNTVIAGS